MPDMVKISHSIDLGPLPDELIPIARRQGEDPNMICNYLEDIHCLRSSSLVASASRRCMEESRLFRWDLKRVRSSWLLR